MTTEIEVIPDQENFKSLLWKKLKPILLFIWKRTPSWVISTIITVFIAVIIQTQNVISRLGNLGADVSFGDRLSMTAYDISHLGTLYGLFIAIALAIAFLAGGLVYHFAKFGRPIIYSVAGGVAILVMLFLMKRAFFDIHIIAGARDGLGIALQVLAGILGGRVFAHLTRNLIKAKVA